MLDLWPVIIMNGIFGRLVLIELGLKLRFERKIDPVGVVTTEDRK